jgi:uncharacterized protein (DUF1330 family)
MATRPAYFIIHAEVHDPAAMAPYHAQVGRTLEAFGGVRLVAGAVPVALEGDAPSGRTVIVRFPDCAAAQAWHDSPAYQAILPHRLAAAHAQAYLVEGAPE